MDIQPKDDPSGGQRETSLIDDEEENEDMDPELDEEGEDQEI